MENTRWWHVAVLGTVVVLSAVASFASHSTMTFIGAVATNAVFVATWFLVGAGARRGSTRALVFVAVTIAAAGASTAFVPSMASMQCIAFPIVWVNTRNLRQAIIGNVALAISVGTGLFVSTGADTNALIQVALIETISLAFSVVLGLWMTSIEGRSRERQRLLDELRAAQEELSTLSRDAGVASERERLAREIHDTIAQDLTGLVLLAQRTNRELGAGDVSAAARHVSALEDAARSALAETRALVAASAPLGLDAGIGPALARLGQRFERETSITTAVNTSLRGSLDRDLEVVLLRCAQEGLANVRKHSGATKAVVSLTMTPITLTVKDNGVGFDTSGSSAGFGLSGMRDRLALVSGTLDLTSSTKGTKLTVSLPTRVPA